MYRDEQMVDLASTPMAQAHPQEGTNTTTLPMSSVFYLPSLLTQLVYSTALISTNCPHLSECRGGYNMASMWPSSVQVDEEHNQGNRHFNLPLKTSDLIHNNKCRVVTVTGSHHNGLIPQS